MDSVKSLWSSLERCRSNFDLKVNFKLQGEQANFPTHTKQKIHTQKKTIINFAHAQLSLYPLQRGTHYIPQHRQHTDSTINAVGMPNHGQRVRSLPGPPPPGPSTPTSPNAVSLHSILDEVRRGIGEQRKIRDDIKRLEQKMGEIGKRLNELLMTQMQSSFSIESSIYKVIIAYCEHLVLQAGINF